MQYNREGERIELMKFAELIEDDDYKIVKQSTLHKNGSKGLLSTVWLGVDYNFSDAGKPIIFETMWFLNDDVPNVLRDFALVGEDCRRYGTEAEARDGHAKQLEVFEHDGWSLKK